MPACLPACSPCEGTCLCACLPCLPSFASRGLQTLVLDDLQCRIYREAVAELGRLTALETLVLSATQRHGVFIFGIDSIPDTWRQLTCLRSLELR